MPGTQLLIMLGDKCRYREEAMSNLSARLMYSLLVFARLLPRAVDACSHHAAGNV
jgi:hypothetical protein